MFLIFENMRRELYGDFQYHAIMKIIFLNGREFRGGVLFVL